MAQRQPQVTHPKIWLPSLFFSIWNSLFYRNSVKNGYLYLKPTYRKISNPYIIKTLCIFTMTSVGNKTAAILAIQTGKQQKQVK